MTADPKKAARAALYIARKTFAGGGNAVQPFDISRENRISPAQTNLGVGSEVTYGNQNAPSYRKVGSETRELPIGGSLSGSEGIIPASHKAPLEGLPSRVKIPLTGEVITAEPNHLIRSVAEKYMLDSGGSYNPPQKYAKVDAVRAKRIADEYERMADDPGHPLVKASYDAMINETMAQYRAAKAAGFKAEFWDPEKERDPYEASPRLAIDDVNKNHHMYVFPTYFGYGSKEIPADAMQKNPLLADSGERWNGHIVTINDIFRAVHDYFGHAKEGVGFRHDGEENAWRSHASMYSPLARLAMTTETRGQNSWLNFGPYGEKNRNAKTEDTVFAPQKIGVMAPWTTHEGAEDFLRPQDREAMEEAYNQYRKAHFSAGGATDDDAFTAYHGTPHEFEPEPDAPYGRFRDTAIGSGEGAQAFGYGHYLAGNEGIAKGYRDRLAKTSDKFTRPSERIKIEGKNLNELMPNASPTLLSLISGSLEAHQGDLKSTHKTLSERGSGLSSIAAKELEPHLNKEVLYQPPYKGHMLETRVRAKPEHFLDWDKPLSEQHPHVQKALESFGFKADPAGMRAHDDALLAALHGSGPESAIPRQPNNPTGQEIHRKLVGGASEWGESKQGAIETAKDLHAAGIPGIRYLDAGSRGPTGAPTHNYVVFDPKNIDIVKRYAQGGEVYSNHAPRHTMQSPAVTELKHLLTMHRDELRSMKGRTQYAAIDGIMKRISHKHGIAPSKLHNDWMSVYHQTPDAWVAGDRGNVVDRALKMTSRGGYAFGGSPAGFASATGAPINFAPAAGAFTGLPSPETLNLAPSKATLAAILASRPTTYTGSGEPVKFSPYVPPSIAAPTFNASSYNLPDNPLEEGQGGSGDRWHPNGGGAPTGGTAELAAAAAAAAGPLGGGYGDSDAAARGGRIHRADGGETGSQLPEPATASMPSKRQAPFGVTPPQGAVPSPMSQATRNLTDPGQVTIKSMSDDFNRAISNHLSLSPGEKITNARQAAQNISEFLGSSKTGKMNALLTANGKLMKAAKSQSGKEPVTISDGRGVETLGLSLFPDFKEGQFRVCGNSDSCRDSCIGKKSNAYSMDPTQAADQIPLTRQDREGMSGKPRMSALARTHALMRDPESFAVYLHDLIDHEKIAAARRGNLLGVRLNTLSDIPPSVFAPIIKAHPDVAFYDYTKMNYDPIAPNHHYTYSSTGVSQPEIGIENPFQNWHKSRDRLDQGENVAMAFSHKSGEAFPRMIHDEETGRHYKVVSGDEHDFRPLDIQDEGKAGVIVALKNIAQDLGHETAAQKSNGFFVKHDPGFVKDKKGNFVKDENGDRIPQNLIYTIRAQQKKRNPLTVFKRSGQDV